MLAMQGGEQVGDCVDRAGRMPGSILALPLAPLDKWATLGFLPWKVPGTARTWHEHSLGSTALCYSEHRVDASSGSCSTTGKEGILSFKQALLPYAPSYKVPDSSQTQGTVVSRVKSLAFYCFGVFLSPKFEASLTFC